MTVQHKNQILENPCEQYREVIREIFLRILSKPDFPISAKLFSLTCFAHEAEFFLYPDKPGFSPSVFAQQNLLEREINRVAEHVYEKTWFEEFDKKFMNLELPMSIVQSLLLEMVQKCEQDFKEMILAAWAEYILEEHKEHEDLNAGRKPWGKVLNIFDITNHDGAVSHVLCSSMTDIYKKRSETLFRIVGPEIERQLDSCCVRFLISSDHTMYRSLLAYVQRLLIHVTLLKYFIASDPYLTEAVRKFNGNENGRMPISDSARTDLGKAVDNFVKRFCDLAAREEKSITQFIPALEEQGMQDIGHMALLIQF